MLEKDGENYEENTQQQTILRSCRRCTDQHLNNLRNAYKQEKAERKAL